MPVPQSARRVAAALATIASASTLGAQSVAGAPPAWPASAFHDGVVREIPIRFVSEGDTLAGWLLRPAGSAPTAVVVMVHGSGPDYARNPYSQTLARALVRAGVGAFLYDKRGYGASQGIGEGESSDSLDILAADAAAAVRALGARRDVRRDAVGFLGVSQGGWVVPLALQRLPAGAAAFAILVGASGDGPLEQQLYHRRAELVANGWAVPDADEAIRLKRLVQRFYAHGDPATRDSAQALLDSARARPWFARVPADGNWRDIPRTSSLPTSAALDSMIQRRPSVFRFRTQTRFDPAPHIAAIRVPVLALWGARDRQVDPVRSDSIYAALLPPARNRDVTRRIHDGAGHTLQLDGTRPIEMRFPPGMLDSLAAWVRARTAPGRR